MNLEETFGQIYATNSWKSEESVSGQGSTLEATAAIRKVLPHIFKAYDIRSILDIPCGDFAWWNEMGINDLITGEDVMRKPDKWFDYTGADIVPELIRKNREKFSGQKFLELDLVTGTLPKVDLVFCRDCLGHLSNANVRLAVKNIKASGAKYLMATTFTDPKWSLDMDILDGEWRPINMMKGAGYALGEPILLINEGFTKNMEYHDKSLGLWKL